MVGYGGKWHQALAQVNLVHRTFLIVLLVHVLRVALKIVSLVIVKIFYVLFLVILILIALGALVTSTPLVTFVNIACVQTDLVIAEGSLTVMVIVDRSTWVSAF